MPADRIDLRLVEALKFRKVSIRRLHKALQAKGGPRTSYQAVRRYVKNEAKPPNDFLRAVVRELRVRAEWLLLGEGPHTVEEFEQQEAQRLGEAERKGIDAAAHHPDAHFIATMEELGPRLSPERWRRLQAVERFARKLHDAGSSAERWAMQPHRFELLRAAARFLVEVEHAFERAGRRDEHSDGNRAVWDVWADDLLVRTSASQGWYVTWSDAVLDLFARRVYGLGERDPGNRWDAHAPVPDAIREQDGARAELLAEIEARREADIARKKLAQKAKRTASRRRRSRGR